MNPKPTKHLEKRSVKGTIVTSKSGESFFRKPHERSMEISDANRTKLLSSVLGNSIHSAKLTNATSTSRTGISADTYKVSMEGADGKQLRGWFKGTQNDPFITDKVLKDYKMLKMLASNQSLLATGQRFLRKDIHLNNRETHKPLTFDEHVAARGMKDHGRDQFKGHMADREFATNALGKLLGIELPDISVKRGEMNADVGKELGVFIRDIPDQFKREDTKRMMLGKEERKLIDQVTATDRHVGDKAVFDYLVGNLDRHDGNYFMRVNGDDSVDMIQFDHGLTFPSSNVNVKKFQKEGGQNDAHPGKGVDVTGEFVQKLVDLAGSEDLDTIRSFIDKNIGKNEEAAFMQRLEHIVSGFFDQDKYNVAALLDI